jgi:hypothetical protein
MYLTNWGGGITATTRDLRLTREQVLRQHAVTGFLQPVTLSHNRWGGPIRVTVAGQHQATARSLGEAIAWCRDNLTALVAA